MSRQERPSFDLAEQFVLMSQKLDAEDDWDLPERLFPTSDGLIYDFEAGDYVAFLNGVSSQSGLVEGLKILGPFADDALISAQGMTEEEFEMFKDALIRERIASEAQDESGSVMPRKWLPILMPERFLQAYPAAIELEVPLGAALIRILELQALEMLPRQEP